jgi:lipopolysaccharide transport system permease protein
MAEPAKALPPSPALLPTVNEPRVIKLVPTKGWIGVNIAELVEYRELIYFLTWRDIKVRYKQTVLGAGWAIIQPFFTMVVFTIFFGNLAKVPSDGVPYPLFSFAALVPWTFFANGLTNASQVLVGSTNLVTKVYFPRLAMPIASVMAGVVDLLIAMVVLFALMLYFGVTPTVNIVWLPAFVLLAIVTALGIGTWLAALNVMFRDVRYVVPFLVQLWMFVTPVVYPASLVEEPWRTVFGLNPMAGVVEGFRWALLGTPAPSASMLAVSTGMGLLLLVSGFFYFRRMESSFADNV